MLFNSVIFLFVFLPITYLVFWSLKAKQARYIWLTITGYVFYGYWDPRFCLLMAFSTLVSYSAGLGFLRWKDPKHRKWCLVLPITVDLLLLGFFKYFNFALDSTRTVASWLGTDVSLPHLNIILPVGISFYTFHTITYIVDSYRGVITPTRNFFEFSTYVSLFSQLVAGPIVRFRQIESDLEHLDSASRTRWIVPGVQFFVVGLVEKVLVADSLAAFVDPALARWESLSTLGAWLAMLGYSLQLYFDFSGYSTMAVGLGYLFGIRIPQNFNSPYKALDPSDFWQRWHISLSSVLRDYLYIPLGGNRRSTIRTYVNLMVTMLLGGLWHGASWTFVVWGAYHGLLLCLHRVFAARWNALPAVARQLGMFFFAVIGWVFFRSTSFTMAAGVLHRMFVPVSGELVAQPTLAAIAVLIAGAWAMSGPNAFDLDVQATWKRRTAVTVAFAASLAIVLGTRSSPFLYFQF
ncbi:MAG: MBOAT family O-acyltransferase [Gemmatimonadaceae bacterium]